MNDNNAVNDMVVSGLDAVMPMEKAQKDILKRVDELIDEAVSTGSLKNITNAMKSLSGISRISGLASAKFIYTIKFAWDKFPQSKNQTSDSYLEDELGYAKPTVKRYNNVWEMLVSGDIPNDYIEKIKLLPIKSLVPISTMWSQDWEITNHDWKELSVAPNVSEVGKIIRKIKGTEPKKDALNLEWNPEKKELVAWKNGKPHFIYLTYAEDDEVIQAALERLFSDKVLEK